MQTDWAAILKTEFEKPYFKKLEQFIETERKHFTVYPSHEHVLRAFELTSHADTRVVILGQDPYHGVNQANGLCFSVNDDVKIPPSLRNIFREVNDDLESVFLPTSGNLEHWAKQGILLLNSSLSVRKDIPNSHKHLKWNVFTDAIIETISSKKENVVFLLWGAFAHKKGLKIDRNKHLVLECGHPSPMSANQGKWFGNKHFSKTNEYLKRNGKSQIDW